MKSSLRDLDWPRRACLVLLVTVMGPGCTSALLRLAPTERTTLTFLKRPSVPGSRSRTILCIPYAVCAHVKCSLTNPRKTLLPGGGHTQRASLTWTNSGCKTWSRRLLAWDTLVKKFVNSSQKSAPRLSKTRRKCSKNTKNANATNRSHPSLSAPWLPWPLSRVCQQASIMFVLGAGPVAVSIGVVVQAVVGIETTHKFSVIVVFVQVTQPAFAAPRLPLISPVLFR